MPLQEGKAVLQEGKTVLQEGKAVLQEGKAVLQEGKAVLQEGKAVLQEGKAVGPYSVPIKLLKMISRPISLPLCLIINESFTSGIFPDNLKLAKVIILYKKGSRDNPTNYRPISLLSIFSKIIEKIMYERVYRFLETCNILYPLQFGFREKHSTLHTIIGMTETIKEAIDNGMFGCGVFIDLQKHLTQSIILFC